MREPTNSPENQVITIPIEQVRCRKDHIRKSSMPLDALRETIEDAGLLQPILVSRAGDGSFNVIDGARRLAALRELGVRDLIIGREIVIDVDETEADVRFKQVIVNVQREDLNPVELGHAFVVLKEEYGYQYNEIAEIIGKTPHYVAAKVGLVKRLDPQVQRLYLEDIAREQCNQSTSPDEPHPYVMNLNAVEDIARVPLEHQLTAYETIKENEMDKVSAIRYLRTLKETPSSGVGLSGGAYAAEPASDDDPAVSPGKWQDKAIRKQVHRISQDIELLSDSMKAGSVVELEIVAEIEEIIIRLSQLCEGIKTMTVNRVRHHEVHVSQCLTGQPKQ